MVLKKTTVLSTFVVVFWVLTIAVWHLQAFLSKEKKSSLSNGPKNLMYSCDSNYWTLTHVLGHEKNYKRCNTKQVHSGGI